VVKPIGYSAIRCPPERASTARFRLRFQEQTRLEPGGHSPGAADRNARIRVFSREPALRRAHRGHGTARFSRDRGGTRLADVARNAVGGSAKAAGAKCQVKIFDRPPSTRSVASAREALPMGHRLPSRRGYVRKIDGRISPTTAATRCPARVPIRVSPGVLRRPPVAGVEENPAPHRERPRRRRDLRRTHTVVTGNRRLNACCSRTI